MKKMVFTLMAFTLLSKIFGFIREITLSYFYGASNISDMYIISQTLPVAMLALIGTGIATSYIPIYTNIVKNKSIELADKFTNNVINFVLIICTVIVISVLLFTIPIVKLFAVGFEGNILKMTVLFTRISIFGVYFSGVTYVLSSYLGIKNNFIASSLIGIPFNFFIIVSIILSGRINILILPFGSLIAVILQMLLYIPFIKKYKYKFIFVLNRKDEYFKKMLYLSVPVIIGVSVNQINVLVDRTIASQILIGGISVLSYANRLIQIVNDVFIGSLATVLYPNISKMAAEDNILGLKKLLLEAVSGINLLVIPATVGTLIFAEPIIKLLFGRGAFDSQSIALTSFALFFYSIGMVGYGQREVLTRVFYSLQDTKTPIINATLAMIMNIILNIILSKYLGISGLALATSISAIFCTGLLFISIRKKIGSFGIKGISITFIKILCASLLMGLFAKLAFNTLNKSISENQSLMVSICIGAIIYFVIIYFMKIDDVDVIVNVIKRKIKNSMKNASQ